MLAHTFLWPLKNALFDDIIFHFVPLFDSVNQSWYVITRALKRVRASYMLPGSPIVRVCLGFCVTFLLKKTSRVAHFLISWHRPVHIIVRTINFKYRPENMLNTPAVFWYAQPFMQQLTFFQHVTQQGSVSIQELQIFSMEVIRQTDQTLTHTQMLNQSAGHVGVSIFSPRYSVCVEEVLITICSLRARPVLMHFLLLLCYSFPLSAPSPCFSSWLWALANLFVFQSRSISILSTAPES